MFVKSFFFLFSLFAKFQPKLFNTSFCKYQAYPAKEKSVRHIFSVRALHLGHLAGSFGLQEPPKTLSRVDRRKGERNVPRSSGKRDLEFATSEENLEIFKKYFKKCSKSDF